jgi:hypothetical protein
MNRDEFVAKLGREPILDDLDRVNCPYAGEIGHSQCGWCNECDHPKFECLCPEPRKLIFIDDKLDTGLSDMEFARSLEEGY